jgi:alkylation response protein AidB-like acyl-CoA dehydrogenase
MSVQTADKATNAPLERARGLAELISADALEGERLGRLTDRVIQAMLDARLFSMFLPASVGGDACSRMEFFETVEETARADGSAGWCLSVCSSIADFTYRGASEQAVAEIFGGGPDTVWTSLLPRATSTPVQGGFQVKGAFNMGSGSAIAGWVVIPAPIEERDGAQWFRGHIIPKAQVRILPNSWDVMGLRATTSIEYVIDDLFVPSHRTFEYPFLDKHAGGGVSAQYGGRLNQIGLTAFACGVAQRSLAELLATAPKTQRTGAQNTLADDPVVQHGLGEHEGRLIAARTQFRSLLCEHDRQMGAQGGISLELNTDTAQAAQMLTQAARDMAIFAFDYAGTGVIFAANPVQRCLRDIFTGLKHPHFTHSVLTGVGQARLGRAVQRPRMSFSAIRGAGPTA